MNTTSTLQLIPPTSPRIAATPVFPLSLVYLFLAGIFLIIVCTVILLERIGKKKKKTKRKSR